MGAKGMEIKESDYRKLVKKFFDSFEQKKGTVSKRNERCRQLYYCKFCRQ